MEWKPIVYGHKNPRIPSERWGHRLINTNSNQLVLFGGFGGSEAQGKYLSDIWTFSTESCTWNALQTSGQIPESRSNYTVHYNLVNDQIILYGGGSNNKIRYNNICILDWKSKVWTSYKPQESTQAPWERTYHSSQFHYPYLIIHGGEGVSNLDLDDMWVFNVQNKKWKQLSFNQNGSAPRKRRFHCTALLKDQFYVIGGCTGNYKLLGDIFRVNLKSLFQQNKFQGFEWECIISKNKLLERWGHSCNIYLGKIFICYGRISSVADTNDTLIFDPNDGSLSRLDLSDRLPIPRRRQASIMVGSSLLVFGGYDGKYLNDFHYLNLQAYSQPQNATFDNIIVDRLEDLQDRLSKQQDMLNCDLQIEIKSKIQQSCVIKTNKSELIRNHFMRNLLKYTQYNRLTIELPQFCDILSFRLTHLSIVKGKVIILKFLDYDHFAKVILANEYFVCSEANKIIQEHLKASANQSNYKQILHLSTFFRFQASQRKAAELYLLNHNQYGENQINFDNTPPNLANQQSSPEDSCGFILPKGSDSKAKILKEVYQSLKFDLSQRKLRENSCNIFEKAAKHIKSIFSKSPQRQKFEIVASKGTEEHHGCMSRMVNYVSGFFTGAKIHSEGIQNPVSS